MELLIILIILISLGSFFVKSAAATEEKQRINFVESHIADCMKRIISHHNTSLKEYANNKREFFGSKKEAQAKLIEWRTEVEKLRLWNKHYKTIMASENFHSATKGQLRDSWYDYLTRYKSIVEMIDVGVDVPFEHLEYLYEVTDNFLATLQAFGYDGEKEQKDIQLKIRGEYRNTAVSKRARA